MAQNLIFMLQRYSYKEPAVFKDGNLQINKLAYNHSYETVDDPVFGKCFLSKGDNFEVYFDDNGDFKFATFNETTEIKFRFFNKIKVVNYKERILPTGEAFVSEEIKINNKPHERKYVLFGRNDIKLVSFHRKNGRWKKDENVENVNLILEWKNLLSKQNYS
jgi:hypothetical protein